MSPSSHPRVGIVLVAAGNGTRLAAGQPKAFVPVAGQTMLQRALAPIAALADPVQLVLVVPEDRLADAAEIASRSGCAAERVIVVPGGAERQDSVLAGVRAMPETVDFVLVHDAARVLTPTEQFQAVIDALQEGAEAVVPVTPVVDTIRQVGDEIGLGPILDRSAMVAVQTPQGAPRTLLLDALRSATDAGVAFTDDAAAIAALGHDVVSVPGSQLAFKITVTEDLDRAEALLAVPPVPAMPADSPVQIGVGADVHAHGGEGVLMLGTLAWPDAPPLAGHSDGDALSHAIVDALLSAAGLGDLGAVFGTDDPRYAGAAGRVFLEAAVELLAERGWQPVSIAAQVIARRPKIGPRRDELEAALSQLLGCTVRVGATTSDGLGITGSGAGIAAVATALIARLP